MLEWTYRLGQGIIKLMLEEGEAGDFWDRLKFIFERMPTECKVLSRSEWHYIVYYLQGCPVCGAKWQITDDGLEFFLFHNKEKIFQ